MNGCATSSPSHTTRNPVEHCAEEEGATSTNQRGRGPRREPHWAQKKKQTIADALPLQSDDESKTVQLRARDPLLSSLCCWSVLASMRCCMITCQLHGRWMNCTWRSTVSRISETSIFKRTLGTRLPGQVCPSLGASMVFCPF